MKLLELINRSNLDMSSKARKARAEAMGFDTSTVWYHANTGGIEGEGFDDSRLPASDPDRPFNAHWFSHEPSAFAAYPSTGNTITPVYLALRKEAPHGVWRKLTAQVHDAWDKGDNDQNAADVIRKKLVSMGYTHAIRGREPIDAEELKSTGETSFMTSTGTKVTLKWEKMMLPGGQPEYTDEEMEIIRALIEAERMYDMYRSLVIDHVMKDKMTPEKSEELKAKGIELKNEVERLKPLSDAANDRAWGVVNDNKEEVDSLEMYDDFIGHVTGYESLADFEASSPEKEDIAVLDPSIIRSIHAEFNPDEADSNKMMASIGEGMSPIVYHGSQSDFDEFDPSKIGSSSGNRGFVGRGFYFTPILQNAQAYGNVKAYRLNMNNPFMITGPLSAEQAEILGNVSETYAFDEGMTPDDVWGGLSYSVPDYPEIADSITDGLESLGYDGVVIKTRDHHEFVAFSPKQIVPVKQEMGEAIGPHRDKEFDLMMKGKKPMALIDPAVESDKEMAKWWHASAIGKVIHKIGINVSFKQDYFVLPGEEWRVAKATEIFQSVRDTGTMTDNNHTMLGRLLGYSDEDINHFLTHIKRPRGIGESERPTPSVAYHATFPEKRDSIRLHGLDPKYDTTFEDGGAVYFATGATPDPKMDIWRVDLEGLPLEYDNVQVTGEKGWGDNEHWWYTTMHVVPDKLQLVQKGKSGILGEAPIRDFDVQPSVSGSDTWGDRDQKRIASPSFETLARKKVKTGIPIDMVIIGLTHDEVSGEPPWMEHNMMSAEFLDMLEGYSGVLAPIVMDEKFGVTIVPATDAITAVFMSNTNDVKDAMPISPWMLCHRLAHSLLDAASKRHLGNDAHANAYPFLNVPLEYMTMRSAQPGKVMSNTGERGVEALAQFLHDGKITLARPVSVHPEMSHIVNLSNGHEVIIGDAGDENPDTVEGLEGDIADMEEQLNISGTIMVDAAVGKLVVAP